METPMGRIQQGEKDLGWGKIGSVMPGQEAGAEITLHDVHILGEAAFEVGGPFRLAIQDDRYDNCLPVNYRNLRPGCDYDRVVFRTADRPKLRQGGVKPPDNEKPEK
jgi:hypothetical protein